MKRLLAFAFGLFLAAPAFGYGNVNFRTSCGVANANSTLLLQRGQVGCFDVAGKIATVSDVNRGGTADTPTCAAGKVCVVATTHGLNTGDYVTFASIVGTTELNTNTYRVTRVDANNFTLAVDGSGFTEYTSGGTATLVAESALNISQCSNYGVTFISNTANASDNDAVLTTYACTQSLAAVDTKLCAPIPFLDGAGAQQTTLTGAAGRARYTSPVGPTFFNAKITTVQAQTSRVMVECR